MNALRKFILENQGLNFPEGKLIPDDVLIVAVHKVFDTSKGAVKNILLDQLHLARSNAMLDELKKIAQESSDTMRVQVTELRNIPTTVPAMMAGLTERVLFKHSEAHFVDIVLISHMRERVLINQRYLDKVRNDQLPSL